MMKRLVFIHLLLIVLSCVSYAEDTSLSTSSLHAPNIVFIFSDDHATSAISAYGESRKLIETPNLDRLASQGMLFERCLATNSICGPSRAATITGKYSHLNGFYNNETTPFDGSQQTFPKILQSAGYQTALIGKWHLGSDPTGFDFWEIVPNQGQYYNPPMIRNGLKVSHTGYVTDIITDISLDWLKKRNKNKPFLLMTHNKAPHMPWEPALKHLNWDNDRVYPEPETLFDKYDHNRGLAWRDTGMEIAKIFNDDHAKINAPRDLNLDQRKIWDTYYKPRNDAYFKMNPQGDDLLRWRYQRYMHDYLATILSIDENVGRILKYLDDEGLSKNTIVIYSSDQGFFLGEHGWLDKRWILEESLRTPFIIRWPSVVKAGSKNNQITSLLDIAETLIDAAGLKVPDDMQGHSLLPLLRGETPLDWRKSFYYHYYEYPRWHRVRPHYGVITDRYKLVHYYKPDVDDWELYDLKVNPHETINYINDPSYAEEVKILRLELSRLEKELKVPAISEEPRSVYGTASFDDPATLPLSKDKK
jgi:arylsulfatase A-like enzyme